MRLRLAVSVVGVVCLAVSSLACSGGDGGSSPAADPEAQDLQQSSAKAKIVVDCSPNDDTGAEIESLEIVRKSGKLTAHLTVSGPGDFIETYSYRVTESAAHTYTGTHFTLSVAKPSDLHAVAPKSAQMFPGQDITEKLDCTESQ
jgi:hypothetical protein